MSGDTQRRGTEDKPRGDSPSTREHRTAKVTDLKPNAINDTVFTTSLTDLSIAKLAENIARRGLRHPLEIRPDGTILDGHRRWLAVKSLCWDEVEVVVVPDVEDDEDVEGYVLDAYSTTRDATVGERVRLFDLALRVLRRRHGRAPGRPRKSGSNDPGFWSRDTIAAEAAKLAGFGSAGTAKRATAVIESGDEDTIAALECGEVSISAAHGKLRAPSSRVSSDDAAPPDDPEPESDSKGGDAEAPSATAPSAVTEPVNKDPNDESDGAEGIDSDEGSVRSSDDEGEQEADDHEASPDDDEPSGEGSDGAETEVSFDAALRVVARALEENGGFKAIRVVQFLARRGGVECWIPEDSDDSATKLSCLLGHVIDILEPLAEDDIRAASMWVERATEDLHEALAMHIHDDEDVDIAG